MDVSIHPDMQVDAAESAAFLDILFSRRSVAPKRLAAPGPSAEELATIVAAGLTAPDHCRLRPWRFLLIPDEERAALGDLFVEEKFQQQPDASDLEIEMERERALNAPTLLAVLIQIADNHSKVPPHEQYVSLGAAIQNILLASHALGYGAMMTSGRKVGSPMLQQAFCRTPSQRLTGFISIGTTLSPPKPRSPVALGDCFAEWHC